MEHPFKKINPLNWWFRSLFKEVRKTGKAPADIAVNNVS